MSSNALGKQKQVSHRTATSPPALTHRNVVHPGLCRTVLTLGLAHDRVLAPTTALHVLARVYTLPANRLAHGEGRHIGRITCLQSRRAEGFTERGLSGERTSSSSGDTRDALLGGGDAEGGTAEGETGVAT